jgi:DNA-binding LytR/AlgR family response regulator
MNKKILIIEDDKDVRANIIALLSEEGYIVISAKNGTDGISVAKEELPDLILCDIMMEKTDGYAVLNELSRIPATGSIPFIFLTAKVEKEDIRTGMKLGADDYIFKPFDADDLLRSIETRLKRIQVLKSEAIIHKGKKEFEKYSLEDKIIVQVKNKVHVINIRDIVYIAAARQYTSLLMSDGKSYIIRKPLSIWERILPDKTFLRIHRSTIINIEFILKMEAWYNSGYVIYLKNLPEPFVLSRRYSLKLKDKLFK